MLFRRARSDPDDWQAYFAYAAQRSAGTLETLVRVAGTRGCIEGAFEDARQEAGLDEYEVRSATGWPGPTRPAGSLSAGSPPSP